MLNCICLGSTALDLFKFYVEDLKSRFHEEKKIIKEILREHSFLVEVRYFYYKTEFLLHLVYLIQVNTTFEEFARIICLDKRSETLDAGNVKLAYHGFVEKVRSLFIFFFFFSPLYSYFEQAEAREKERLREENRRQRKLEIAFRSLLKEMDVDYKSDWDDVRGQIENHQAFQAITLESERLRIFKVMFGQFVFYKIKTKVLSAFFSNKRLNGFTGFSIYMFIS